MMRRGSTMRRTVFAPAKLNLLLAVGATRADGYHEVSSIMQTLDLADRIDIDVERWNSDRVDVLVEAPGVPGGDTLVTRALEQLLERASIGARVWVTIEKEIPVGAGLGGGSSDAAAAIVALNELLGEPLEQAALQAIAAGIGSDVPFFLGGADACAWASGRGEQIEPIEPLPTRSWLLAWPNVLQSTQRVYGAFEPSRATALPDTAAAARAIVESGELRNDLEPAARAECLELDRLVRAFEDAGGAPLVCGSGATVAVEAGTMEELQAFAAVARSAVAGCWTRPVSTGVH